MEDLFETLTRGNLTEVKVVATSVVAALALYQVLLMAVGYGRLRVPFLAAGPASRAHRAAGDAIVGVTVFIALACVSVGGFDDGGAHAIAGAVLLGVLACKVVAVRRGGRLGRALPVLGLCVLGAFAGTWALSAGAFLEGRP